MDQGRVPIYLKNHAGKVIFMLHIPKRDRLCYLHIISGKPPMGELRSPQ
jgi:hypothetical protein